MRYIRQTMLPDIGPDGQRRLMDSSVLIVGLGGLGSPVAQYLTGAGIGRIGLADHDTVSLHNLHRQTLYVEADVGCPKVDSALRRLSAMSGHTRFDLHSDGLTPDNAEAVITTYDLVVDCTDNFATRFIINDTCARLHKPWILGAVSGTNGHVGVMGYDGGPDLSALYDDATRAGLIALPPASGGVTGPAPGVVGAIQASEAVRILSGNVPPLAGRLFTIELSTMQTSLINL